MKPILILPVALSLAVAACGTTTKVSTKSVAVDPREVFWAKNELAERTADPGAALFRNFWVADLSNGDRIYCGEMNAVNGVGGYLGYQPFYLRRSGGAVKALNWGEERAAFSAEKCAEARSGALRIDNV